MCVCVDCSMLSQFWTHEKIQIFIAKMDIEPIHTFPSNHMDPDDFALDFPLTAFYYPVWIDDQLT